MTKKDGVDVNECDFFIKNRDKYLCRCTKINSFGDIVTPKNAENSNCLDNYHCYYKQLARKTQECELLETQLESYHIGEPKLIQRIQELEQECEELKEENEELKAQRDTYVNLMNVYKNISKGRADSEIVIDYIDKLEKKLKIAEEALNDIKNSFFEDEDKEIITHAESIYYYSKAKEALQKMKEVQND